MAFDVLGGGVSRVGVRWRLPLTLTLLIGAAQPVSLLAAAAIEDIGARTPAAGSGVQAAPATSAPAVVAAPVASADRGPASGQALLELMRRIEELQIEVQNLRGEVEGMNNGLDAVKTRQREMFLDLDRRMQEMETTGRSTPGGGGVAASDGAVAGAAMSGAAATGMAVGAGAMAGAGVAAAAPSGDPAAARAAYERAFGLLREQKYEAAITDFERFLADFSASEYAANAQYWLGEANYATRRYEQAVTAFKSVASNYPGSGKVADAYLKLGFTYYEMSRWGDARQALNTAKSQFPNSSAARLAQDRLNRMVQEGH